MYANMNIASTMYLSSALTALSNEQESLDFISCNHHIARILQPYEILLHPFPKHIVGQKEKLKGVPGTSSTYKRKLIRVLELEGIQQ